MLNDQELSLTKDQEFLLTKKAIDRKVTGLLIESQERIKSFSEKNDLAIPAEVSINPRKIAKGENLQDMPYWVSDYPAYFSQADLWTFRSMVWWGHGVEMSLIIKGAFKESLALSKSQIVSTDLYYALGTDPWQLEDPKKPWVNFTRENAVLILNHHESHDFLKLTYKASLEEINILPELCVISFEKIMRVLHYLA